MAAGLHGKRGPVAVPLVMAVVSIVCVTAPDRRRATMAGSALARQGKIEHVTSRNAEVSLGAGETMHEFRKNAIQENPNCVLNREECGLN